MGFRKALKDVEEKGLEPTVPYKELGPDGRLSTTLSNTSAPVVGEEYLDTSAVITNEHKDVVKTPEQANKEKNSETVVVDELHDVQTELSVEKEKSKSKPATKKPTTKK
jgi:hypothetical protein